MNFVFVPTRGKLAVERTLPNRIILCVMITKLHNYEFDVNSHKYWTIRLKRQFKPCYWNTMYEYKTQFSYLYTCMHKISEQLSSPGNAHDYIHVCVKTYFRKMQLRKEKRKMCRNSYQIIKQKTLYIMHQNINTVINYHSSC